MGSTPTVRTNDLNGLDAVRLYLIRALRNHPTRPGDKSAGVMRQHVVRQGSASARAADADAISWAQGRKPRIHSVASQSMKPIITQAAFVPSV